LSADAPAKSSAGTKADATAARVAAKDERITLADWLDLASKVVDAANELFPFRAAPARVIAGPVGLPNIAQQFNQQYGPRFRQMYRSELHLMRMACQPSREQFDKISAAGEAELKEVVQTCSEYWRRQRQGGRVPGENGPEVRKLIAAGIAKSVKSILSPEQAARYQEELDGREAARRHVVLAKIVASVDRRLILTADQRAKLAAVLEKNWRPWWGHLFLRFGDVVPQLADEQVLPILNEAQKVVWQKTTKMHAWMGFELDYYQLLEIGDEVWPVAAGDEK
jgi:hypothetical protein